MSSFFFVSATRCLFRSYQYGDKSADFSRSYTKDVSLVAKIIAKPPVGTKHYMAFRLAPALILVQDPCARRMSFANRGVMREQRQLRQIAVIRCAYCCCVAIAPASGVIATGPNSHKRLSHIYIYIYV